MHQILLRLDLNLLLVFDALYRHRSVVAAAEELSMSPSACSHALSRLRGTLSDELFVRYGNAMQPTSQAEHMAEGVADALSMLSDRLASAGPFVPLTSTQTFTLAGTDFSAFALLPSLIATIEKQAPKLHLKMTYDTKFNSLEDLASGRVQFMLGLGDEYSVDSEGIQSLNCVTDDYVVAARAGHPRISKNISLEQYLSERHVAATPWKDVGSVIDLALAKQNLSRDVAVQLPSLLAAPFVVASTDYLITLPRQVAKHFGVATALSIYPTPFPIPRYALRVYFHVKYAGQPGHRWMRDQMLLALGNHHLDD